MIDTTILVISALVATYVVGWLLAAVWCEYNNPYDDDYLVWAWTWPVIVPIVIISGLGVVIGERLRQWRTRSK